MKTVHIEMLYGKAGALIFYSVRFSVKKVNVYNLEI